MIPDIITKKTPLPLFIKKKARLSTLDCNKKTKRSLNNSHTKLMIMYMAAILKGLSFFIKWVTAKLSVLIYKRKTEIICNKAAKFNQNYK